MKRIAFAILLAFAATTSWAQGVLQVAPNEPTAIYRTVCFRLVLATDAISPATAEAGGQPQISITQGAWTDTGISTLTAISGAANGRYCAAVTQATLTYRAVIRTRYKSTNTAEAPGETLQATDGIRAGTAQAGSNGSSPTFIPTITLDSSASASSETYRQRTIEITGGTGVGQGPRKITRYDGTTKVATVDLAWSVVPNSTSTFRIY